MEDDNWDGFRETVTGKFLYISFSESWSIKENLDYQEGYSCYQNRFFHFANKRVVSNIKLLGLGS
jgi:hypothetical protein